MIINRNYQRTRRNRVGIYIKLFFFLLTIGCFIGCGRESEERDSQTETVQEIEKEPIELETGSEVVAKEETPSVIEMDWGKYFTDLEGAAVFYNPENNQYLIYNQELANIQRSPCSTFKIISSLIALQEGVILPDNSIRKWNGETFWKEEWNQDLPFEEAFAQSCVWYFREVINDLGQEKIQEELDRLSYGNCDISDWQGSMNNNNNNPLLTGFWIESSLLISPKEQTEVLARIFEADSDYSKEVLDKLKAVMYLSENSQKEDISIYGKTGMGKSNGVTVDAWYTGFLERTEKRIYFCVYLGESTGEVSSPKAREIAVSLAKEEEILNWFKEP